MWMATLSGHSYSVREDRPPTSVKIAAKANENKSLSKPESDTSGCKTEDVPNDEEDTNSQNNDNSELSNADTQTGEISDGPNIVKSEQSDPDKEGTPSEGEK